MRKKQRNEITNEDEEQFQEHQTKKEKSREEKRLDKERAKTDRSFTAVTFDLEAVLPTPCSMVVSGETINWLKVKWIRVTKENPGSVFFNNGFDPENFMEAKFQSSSLRGRKKTGNIKLSPLNESKLQISTAKKADLLSLCKSGVIPTTYHYESLPVGKLVKDTLPEPDITDENLIDNI
ncbi:unnamed protein product [Mytilus coruscus]|uniref:Uncharacterized protein n=1 Tax=Mytilus coruscus TaxID=42192 RepID=A0A6J8A2N2_MYTCO|nr:unnamed protein product [Mytilus coruscus]